MAKCSAKTKEGKPCQIPTPEGKKYCHVHSKQRKRRRIFASVSAGTLLVVLGFIADVTGIFGYLGLNPPQQDTRPYNAQIQGQDDGIVIAYNREGRTLWQVDLDSQVNKAVVDDVDQDGDKEVIISTHEPGKRPGWLLAFDEKGTLIDEYNTWKPTLYQPTALFGAASEQFNVQTFSIVDLTGDGTKEIVVVSQDVYWYVSRLTVLHFDDRQFRELSEYWHPGLLRTLHIADIDDDGIQEVVCTGENNHLQSVIPLGSNIFVVFAFDGSNISGQAPPYFADGSRGTELWYGYVVPSPIGVKEVGFVDVNGDGVAEFHITLSDVCSWYLDAKGETIKRGIGSACKGESELIVLQTDHSD